LKINSILDDVKGTKAQKALRYGLSSSDMSTIVIGLANIEHLEEALEGYNLGHLDEEILVKIKKLQNNNFNWGLIMKVLILGVGGLGGFFGAHLQKTNCDVTFLVRDKTKKIVSENGIKLLSDFGNFKIKSISW